MAKDPLTCILARLAVEMTPPVRLESAGPFSLRFGPYSHCKFVTVLRGAFDLHIDGARAPVSLAAGDGYLLTDGRPYRTYNADIPDVDALTLFTTDRGADGITRLGKGKPDTIIMGCLVLLDAEAAVRLRAELPHIVRLAAGTIEAANFQTALTLLHAESSGKSGDGILVGSLINILFVEVARAWRDGHPRTMEGTLVDV